MDPTEDKTVEEARAEAAAAHEELLEKSRENLDAVFGDKPTPDESESESTSEQSEENQTDESQETDESTSKQTDESVSKDESTSEQSEEDQTDDTSDSEADDKPKLTQAEIRAAQHLGWSGEEIDALVEANPDLAKKTCAKALESTNNLSKKFSELGKTQATKKEEPAVPMVIADDPNIPGGRIAIPASQKPIDFTALEKDYEGDPIIGVVKQIAEQNQMLATEIGTLRDASAQGDAKVTAAQAQQDAAISQQIDTFFESPDVATYSDTYGKVEKGSKDWDNLTQGQIKKRYEVMEQANLILLGAKQQGMDMPLDEAFERAHLLVTEDVREQTIRKEIKAKTVKRSKSLTLEPTDSKKVPSTGKKSMDEVHANAKQGLQKVFRS